MSPTPDGFTMRKVCLEPIFFDPDGLLLGTCELSPSKGETAYRIHSIPIEPAFGRHAFVLVFRGESGVDLMNLEWLTFE